MSDFVELLRRGQARTDKKTQVALGEALGLSEQRISSAMKSNGYKFDVLNCLKLARFIEEEDWTVLRAAGKGPIADLLQQTHDIVIAGRDKRVLRDLQALSAEDREHVTAIIRSLADARRKTSKPSR